eukprot:gene16728-biopygen20313
MGWDTRWERRTHIQSSTAATRLERACCASEWCPNLDPPTPPPHPPRPRARATGAGVDARAHNGREALRVRERHHVVAGAVPKRSRGRGRTTLRHCFWASERFWAGHVFSLWRDTSGGTTKACVPEPGQRDVYEWHGWHLCLEHLQFHARGGRGHSPVPARPGAGPRMGAGSAGRLVIEVRSNRQGPAFQPGKPGTQPGEWGNLLRSSAPQAPEHKKKWRECRGNDNFAHSTPQMHALREKKQKTWRRRRRHRRKNATPCAPIPQHGRTLL